MLRLILVIVNIPVYLFIAWLASATFHHTNHVHARRSPYRSCAASSRAFSRVSAIVTGFPSRRLLSSAASMKA